MSINAHPRFNRALSVALQKEEDSWNGNYCSETVGEIVAAFPGAGNLMKKHKTISLRRQPPCRSLAARESMKKFLEELNRLHQQAWKNNNRTWTGETRLGDLIDHIVQNTTPTCSKNFPLSQFVTKIFRVHGAHPELARLHRLFHQLKTDLSSDWSRKRKRCSPHQGSGRAEPGPSKSERNPRQLKTTSAAGELLREMRNHGRHRLPEGACRTYTLTFRKLELEADIPAHHRKTTCCSRVSRQA